MFNDKLKQLLKIKQFKNNQYIKDITNTIELKFNVFLKNEFLLILFYNFIFNLIILIFF